MTMTEYYRSTRDDEHARRMELAGQIGSMRAYIGQAKAALRNEDTKLAFWCLEQAMKAEG